MITDYKQQQFRDQKLISLIDWLEKFTGFEFIETSSYRHGDTGVHGTMPVRGVDLRCRSNDVGITIEALINKYWQYDQNQPGKKCCLLHGEGSSLHLHLQVHPNTQFSER